jgi:hypothetical protein
LNFRFVEVRPGCYKDSVPRSPELLTFAAGALAVFAMLLTVALTAARRRVTALLQGGRERSPDDRRRDGACVCLPDASFDPFYDASR